MNKPGIQPASTRAYKGPDCSEDDELGSVLPEAKLDSSDSTKTYKLLVPTLPKTRQTVCFKCVYTRPNHLAGSPSPDCTVKVAVSAASDEGGTTTAAKPTTGSSSVAAAASAFTVSAVLVSTVGVK